MSDYQKEPSAWQWSRGADVLVLILLLALLIVAGALAQAGMKVLALLIFGVVGSIFVALIIHAATAGRRFGKPPRR
jgi:hypothetical protein